MRREDVAGPGACPGAGRLNGDERGPTSVSPGCLRIDVQSADYGQAEEENTASGDERRHRGGIA